MSWTQEESDLLIKRYNDTKTEDLAIILSKSKTAVTSKIYRLKKEGKIVSSRKPQSVMIEELKKEISINHGNLAESFRNVANRTGYSYNYIKNYWYRHRNSIGYCFMVIGKRHNINQKIYNKSVSKPSVKLWNKIIIFFKNIYKRGNVTWHG